MKIFLKEKMLIKIFKLKNENINYGFYQWTNLGNDTMSITYTHCNIIRFSKLYKKCHGNVKSLLSTLWMGGPLWILSLKRLWWKKLIVYFWGIKWLFIVQQGQYYST